MAKYDTSKMLASYTSDFGATYSNVPVRWTTEAFVPDGVYVDRVAGCGGSLNFTPRYLEAEFSYGTHKYIVNTIGSIITLRDALITGGATCVSLVGEKWSNIPDNMLGGLTYKTTPYAAADINGAGDRETGKYDYASDVLGSPTRLGYSIENTNAGLLTAQKAGLSNAVEGGIGSRPSTNLIKPRHFQIVALVDDDTTIRRKVNCSAAANLTTVAETIDDAAYFLAYQGESIVQLQNI